MDLKPIKTKADYRAMLKEIDSLMGLNTSHRKASGSTCW